MLEGGAILRVRKLSRGLALQAIAAVAVAAGLAGAATAATVVGTAKNDVLNGTTKADKLYGRGGNDKLSGKGGNDLLVGGPGADRIFCGGGKDNCPRRPSRHRRGRLRDRDRAHDDTTGAVAARSAHSAPPPPAPPAPPAAKAIAGRSPGFTNNGYGFCFDVQATGDTFTNAVFEIQDGLQTRRDLQGDVLDDGRDADQTRPHVLLRRYVRRGSWELSQRQVRHRGERRRGRPHRDVVQL